MEIKHTIEILTKDIQDIEKLVGNLKNSQEGSAIELDLALSKLRNVYEILTMIKADMLYARTQPVQPVRKTTSGPTPNPVPEPVPGPVLVPQSEPAPEPEPTPEPEPEPTPASKTVPEPTPEPKTAPEPTPASKTVPEPTPEPKTTPEQIAGASQHTEILAEKFSTESSINENMASQRGEDIDSKLMGQPIENISRNIGINDRFLIIRELFDGNAEGFRKLVDDLEGVGNYEDAFKLIGKSFSASMEHEGVGILIGLAKRRYIRK